MPAREAWGLDIGQTALHAIKIQRAKGPAQITDFFFYELGTEPEDPDYHDKVLAGLQAFKQEKQVGSTPIVVSLPGYSTLFREFNLPATSGSRLAEIVGYEARQLIPYPLEEVIYDYHQLRFDPDTGEITIALLCCRRDIIERVLEGFDALGLNVDCLQVGPLGLFNYMMYEHEPEGAVLVLDTGARGTDFIVINDGTFWLRSIGVSGVDLSKALMNKYSKNFDDAEKIKREMGQSKQADRVFRVLAPVLSNLCGEVQRSIGYYKSLFRGVAIERVYCEGNTYLLSGVDQFVADNLQLETYTMNLPETLDVHFSVDTGELEAHRQVIGTATGLALQGVGLAPVNINLLPRERIIKKTIARKISWAAAAVALMLVSVVVGYLCAGGQAEKFKGVKETAARIEARAGKAKKEYKAVLAMYPAEEARSRALAQVSGTRGMLLEVMGQLLALLEKWNREQDNLALRATLMQREAKELFNKYYLDFKLGPEDENLDKLKEALRQEIEQRLAWKYNRLHRIFFDKLECKVVKYRRKVNTKQPGQFEWLGPVAAARTNAKVRDRAGFRTEEVPVVEVHVAGFMVFTSKRTTGERAQAIDFKDRVVKLPGMLPKTFKYVLKTSRDAVNSIQLPVVQDPHPPAQSAAAAGETRGGKPPATPARGMMFEIAQEPVGRFTYSFVYAPRL